jgi:HSP20 family molecular chaperone IbpA
MLSRRQPLSHFFDFDRDYLVDLFDVKKDLYHPWFQLSSNSINKLQKNYYSMVETENEIKYTFNVPGYNKDNIVVKLNKNNTVSVSAKNQAENETKSLFYSFSLPDYIDKNTLTGTVVNGQLELILKKINKPELTEKIIKLD